jgi:hypothetical protein
LVPTFLYTYPRFATTQQVLDFLFKSWVTQIQAQGSSPEWVLGVLHTCLKFYSPCRM